MKRSLLVFCIVAFGLSAKAQTIAPEDAAKHVGDSVTVCGKIFGGRFFETSKNSPTLLNMGAAFPKSPLTIMIPGDVRTRLGYIPEAELKDKNICVRGRIVLYKEKHEIIVYDVSQIEVQK